MSSSQKLLALLVGACLVSVIAADYKCAPDKKWDDCTCHKDHYCGGKDPGCKDGCKEGCVCKDPKHRMHENNCIPADKCPPVGGKCPTDMVWSDCCGCNDECQKQGTVCKAGCEKAGCKCKDSEYRLQDNACIHHTKCPGYCPPDMVWSDCSGCNDECQGNNMPCTTKCEKRCVCKASGYKLQGNKCIPDKECPGNCPSDMMWSDCCGCNDQCQKKDTVCTAGCRKGCKCKNPEHRLQDNKCIHHTKCPGKCPTDMVWSDCCGCNDECQKKGTVCKAGCTKGCKCKDSEHRLQDNKCIHHTKCPGICPQGAEWQKCSGCKDHNCGGKGMDCTHGCDNPGCVCEKGYKLHENKCIPADKCPGYCPSDMMWSDCCGCNDSCQKEGTVCAAVCTKGCKCKDSKHKLHNNKCIHHTQCPS